MRTKQNDWFTCPVCGEVVDGGALACRACGADDETGWSEEAEYDGVDLADQAFDDPPRPTRQNSVAFYLATLAMIVVFLLWAIGATS